MAWRIARTPEIAFRVGALQPNIPAGRLRARSHGTRVGGKELEWGFRLDLDAVLTAARAGYEGVTDEQLAALTPVGEARARQGIPIADVLLARRIGVQVVIDRATEIGPQLDISEAEMLRFVRALIGASDRAMAIIASAHRTADLELATREQARRAAVATDRAVGDALLRRYLEPLAGSQAEIAAGLRVLFESDMHVERAAEKLFVHPNTLRYRIGRFEEITGANLRSPRSALEVWWALQRDGIHTRGAPS